LALLGPKIYLELEQFIGFGDLFGGADFGNFQLEMLKVYSLTLQSRSIRWITKSPQAFGVPGKIKNASFPPSNPDFFSFTMHTNILQDFFRA